MVEIKRKQQSAQPKEIEEASEYNDNLFSEPTYDSYHDKKDKVDANNREPIFDFYSDKDDNDDLDNGEPKYASYLDEEYEIDIIITNEFVNVPLTHLAQDYEIDEVIVDELVHCIILHTLSVIMRLSMSIKLIFLALTSLII